jgi:hypothetical protein
MSPLSDRARLHSRSVPTTGNSKKKAIVGASKDENKQFRVLEFIELYRCSFRGKAFMMRINTSKQQCCHFVGADPCVRATAILIASP